MWLEKDSSGFNFVKPSFYIGFVVGGDDGGRTQKAMDQTVVFLETNIKV